MGRAVPCVLAFILTGTPATLACLGSCAMARPSSAGGHCQHEERTTTSSASAASKACATPLGGFSFVIEATYRLQGLTEMVLPLAAVAGNAAAERLAPDSPVPFDSPPARVLLSHTISPVLRV